MQPGDVTETYADISAIERDLGFQPDDQPSTRAFRASSTGIAIITRWIDGPVPTILSRLRLPVIGAPLFIISNPKLVIAQCKAGIVGSFPALNARPQSQLDEWIHEITEALAAHDRDHPEPPAAPFAVNQIVHRSNDRFEADIATCAKWKVPIVITSLGARTELNDAVHGWGGITLHDIIDDRFARKAIEKGADGLIAVAAGAGGHAGNWSPFALVQEIRTWFDGPLILSGAIATGGAVLAAQAMGADLAYIGSPFIATDEARASDDYKQGIVAGGAADIVYSNLFTGIHGNYLRGSIVRAGLDPDKLARGGPGGDEVPVGEAGAKAWRDIWGSGQGIGVIDKVRPAGELVDSARRGICRGEGADLRLDGAIGSSARRHASGIGTGRRDWRSTIDVDEMPLRRRLRSRRRRRSRSDSGCSTCRDARSPMPDLDVAGKGQRREVGAAGFDDERRSDRHASMSSRPCPTSQAFTALSNHW